MAASAKAKREYDVLVSYGFMIDGRLVQSMDVPEVGIVPVFTAHCAPVPQMVVNTNDMKMGGVPADVAMHYVAHRAYCTDGMYRCAGRVGPAALKPTRVIRKGMYYMTTAQCKACVAHHWRGVKRPETKTVPSAPVPSAPTPAAPKPLPPITDQVAIALFGDYVKDPNVAKLVNDPVVGLSAVSALVDRIHADYHVAAARLHLLNTLLGK